MPVRYQRFTYRYLQGRPRSAETAFERIWLAGLQPSPVTGRRRPPVDVWETATELVVKILLPGVEEDEIRALLYEDALLVTGLRVDDAGGEERRYHRAEVHYGPLEVTVPLPVAVEPDGVDATYRHGMLTIRLRKRQAEPERGAQL